MLKEIKILPWDFEKAPELGWDEPCPCALLAR